MDSSSILHNQSQNKIQNDSLRMKNGHNNMTTDPKPFKLHSTPDLFNQDSENQDPENSKMVQKALQRPGVSRLPVLAKSLHLQTPSNFSQSHCRWEDKPLAGKAKKKKPCTRPVPFNLSQPKSLRVASENQQPSNVSQLRTGTQAVQLERNVCNASLKKQNINAKPSKHQSGVSSTATSIKGTLKSHVNYTDNVIHPTGQSRPCNTFKPSSTLSSSLSSITNNTVHRNDASSSAQSSVSVESSIYTEPVKVKGPTKTSHGCQNPQLTTQGNYSKSSTGENFHPDHAALLSILCNEGVNTTGLVSGTPQSKPYNCLPQRVSVMKSQHKAGRVTVKSVQFSPDASALQSILQNEGVKAVGDSSRNSVCPSGRATSVYTAQRVPVKKNRAELIAGSVAVAVKDIPLYRWTPQRVRDTRHQPMSAMKWHLSTQPSPYPGTLGSCKTDLQPKQEEVVQRLFYDHDDEHTEKDPETQAEQLQPLNSATTSYCKEDVETSGANTSKDDEDGQEHPGVEGQSFFHAPGRESVIFFSTGKKLFRAPCLEKQENSSHEDQRGPDSSEQGTSKLVEEILSVGGPTCPLKPAVQNLHRDLILQKSCALSPAVALLRKRLPPLEELRMDEEVATYTSSSVSAAPGFLPPRPRCGNPLAAILHFEESTKFVPIAFDLSSSSLSLTLQE